MVAKIGDWFPKFKLQGQLLTLLVLSTTIPVAIGLYGTFSFTRISSASFLEEFEEEAEAQAAVVESALEGVEEDVLFLSNVPEVQGIIFSQANLDREKQTTDAWKQQLAGVFLAMLEAKPQYQKLRFINEEGQEVIRVVREGENRDQLTITPDSELLDKSESSYVQKTKELEAGEIWVSQIHLQTKDGKVTEPYLPHNDFSTPIFDRSGELQGMIVASLFADDFLELVEELEEEEEEAFEGETLFMVAADGHYMLHPDEDKAWGNDLGHEESLQQDYDADTVNEILSNDDGLVQEGNKLLVFARIDPNDEQEGDHFYVIEELPKKIIYSSANSYLLATTIIMLVALAIALPLGVFRGRQVIGFLQGLINSISTTSQQIFSAVSEQERIATQQAAAFNETVTTMEELEASSRQSAEQATTAAKAAKTALEQAEMGSDAVDKAMEGMFTVEQKVDAIAQRIVELSGQAGQIGTISQLVSDFAHQTNMLALNSSVEAVRAGEYGKGFAIVANEIRKLADQSQGSASKIKSLVEDIQKAINETVMVTEEGTKTVKLGVENAKRTEESFSDIKQGVAEVVLNNQQVALNQKQQVDAIRQVVQAMETLELTTKENVAGLTQTRTGTQQLNREAQSLQGAI